MKNLMFLALGLTLIINSSCSKEEDIKIVPSSNSFVRPEIPVVNPDTNTDINTDTNTDVDTSGDTSVPDITKPQLSPDDPCFKYVNNSRVKTVASCTKVITGKVKKVYDFEVTDVAFCILEQFNSSSNTTVHTLVGTFEDVDKGETSKRTLDVFAASKKEKDTFYFEKKKDKLWNYIRYDFTTTTLSFKQKNGGLFKKRLRFAKILCDEI